MMQLVQRRLFSRADILKTLDRTKVSRKAFIKRELLDNPEFFKAYPHMQGLFNADQEEEGLGKKESPDPTYHEDSTVSFKDPAAKTEYFKSLLDHHNQYLGAQEKEEAIRDNERHFIDAYQSPTGPFKWLSAEQLEQVHLQIDAKMQELEDSGLTREEILYNS